MATYPHPGVNIHQAAARDRLHDAVVVLEDLLQLTIAMAIGGAKHQHAHHVGHGPGDGGSRVQATPPAGQQLLREVVDGRQDCRRKGLKLLLLLLEGTGKSRRSSSPMSWRRALPSPNRPKEAWTSRRWPLQSGQ